MPYVYSRPYVYSFWQIFQALRLFPALRLFRTLEYINFWKHIEKCWDPVVFALIFQKNIEKVLDIEKVWDIQKKSRQKRHRDPTFFYVKVFRWTGLMSSKCLVKNLTPIYKINCFKKMSKKVNNKKNAR